MERIYKIISEKGTDRYRKRQQRKRKKEFLELVYKARRIGRNPKTILRMYPIGFGRLGHTPYGSPRYFMYLLKEAKRRVFLYRH